MGEKVKIKTIITIVISGLIIFAVIGYWNSCNADKQIIKQTAEIISQETKIQAKEKAIQDLKEKIKQRDGKLSLLTRSQEKTELSLRESEEELSNSIEKISRLKIKNEKVLRVPIKQWEKALIEIEKYKTVNRVNEAMYKNIITELKLKIEEQDSLLTLWEDYRKLNDSLKITLNKQIINLAKKANRRLHFGTLNVDLINYSASGIEYTSIGFGISYQIFKKKFSVLDILKTIKRLN